MRLKVLAAVALIVVGVGAMGVAIFQPSLGGTSSVQYLTAAAATQNVMAQSVATGTIAPTAYYGLAFGADPQLASGVSSASTGSGGSAAASTGGSGASGGSAVWPVKTVDVKVGDHVTQGQTLAVADTANAALSVTVAKANLAAANAKLAVDAGHASATVLRAAQDTVNQAALAGVATQHNQQITIQQNQLAVDQANAALANADATLQQAQAGPTADAKASAQAALDNAELALQQAQQAQQAQEAKDALSIQQAQQSVTNAQAQWFSAVGTNAIQAAQNAIDTAQLNLQGAQLAAQTAEQQAAAAVTQAQNNLASAQAAYDANTNPSSTAVQAAQQQVGSAQQAVMAAQQKLAAAQTQQGDSLAQARQSLLAAQDNYLKSTGPATPDVIANDQATVATAKSNLTTAEKTMARATLVAPAAGVVVAVNVQPGLDAPSGYAVVLQSDTFEVTASFAEGDVINLKLGQPATVTITSSNTTVDGTVSQIVPVGSAATGNNVVSYNVSVTLGDPASTILTGMSANVAVTTAEVQNVVAVPSTALVGTGGTYFVRVLDGNGQPQTVPVEVGLVTSSLAEVKSGLTDGERVVVGTVSPRTQTTTGGGVAGIGGLGGGLGGGFGGGFGNRGTGGGTGGARTGTGQGSTGGGAGQ